MSKDDSNGGFLSKVARFVRHPTTSWSDLDTRSADRESEYSKAALKEMIERKRRNDFVRKREFDMLRKIRSREASGESGQGVRPSFFQSSLPSKPDDRATTLKKIDEIEAQMSMQWWKTKSPDASATGSTLSSGPRSLGGTPVRPDSEKTEESANAPAARRRAAQYSKTEPAPLVSPTARHAPASGVPAAPTAAPIPQAAPVPAVPRVNEPVSVQPTTASGSARTGLMALTGQGASSEGGAAFSASHFFGQDVEETVLDPEIEEASIRFANGDDAGAEQGLLETVGVGQSGENRLDDWLALFDLYRATGQLAPFESRALDFVNRFGRSGPQWVDMPEQVSTMTGKTYKPTVANARAAWVSDAELDAHAVGTLQNVLLRVAQPWVLDWTPLETIDQKAARALLGIFTLWGDQDIDIGFLGSPHLREVLKESTPSGRRDVEQLWWELRMAALRIMNRPDEFELTALDFCVTYEVSPPGWEKPACHFRKLSSTQDSDAGSSVLSEATLEQVSSDDSHFSGYPGETGAESHASGYNQLGLVELSGEIRGDPQSTLDMLEGRLKGSDVLIISCRNLIRVDFSAAGTLLNWVSSHHSEGRMVQFVDVHRLVSAFFHVIGITEYAKVVLRND